MTFRPIKHSQILFLALLAAQSAFAIVTRDDRDDEKYLALAARYPASGLFGKVGCTLIAPQWAITAAHVIEDNPAFVEHTVTFGTKNYQVEKIVIHPARVMGAVDSSADLALLKLKEPVTDIKPALLYEKTDEANKMVTLVGPGTTGTGLTGATGERGKMRAATNQIDGTLENSILIVFDAPPFGTDLEGIGGAGDSGSPVLYEEGGKLYLVGVDSFNTGDAEKKTLSKYLTVAGYARISTRRKWILDAIANDAPDNLWGVTKPIRNGVFPPGIFGQRAAAFFKAFNAGNEAAIAEFYDKHRPLSPEGKTPGERAAGWQKLMDEYGTYKASGYATHGHFNFCYLVFSSKAKIWRGVQLEFEETKPFRIKSMRMWDATVPDGFREQTGIPNL